MVTAAQITANRLNAARSTGPRTDDGKAIVRQNALRHGLCADFPRMCDEKRDEIQQLLDILREEHQPADATEEILVYKMAEQFWASKRASQYVARQLDCVDIAPTSAGVSLLSVMLRYQSTADRAYYKALTELRKLQKERQLQEIGFVSQRPPAQPIAAPAAPQTAAPSAPVPPASAIQSAKAPADAPSPLKNAA